MSVTEAVTTTYPSSTCRALASRADGAPVVAARIALDGLRLNADLAIPPDARAIVLVAQLTGSQRNSPRRRHMDDALHGAGLATVRFDLLTRDEARVDAATGLHRFDVPFLATRLDAVTEVVARRPETAQLPVAYLGVGTAAAAALVVAAGRGDVAAVVSCAGRPDLAGPFLGRVAAPTLLVVGGDDGALLRYNRQALAAMSCTRRLEVVHGATHLLEEGGVPERVAAVSRAWLARFIQPAAVAAR